MKGLALTVAVVMLCLLAPSPSSSQGRLPPSVPVEPVGAILDAFRSHAIVTISDSHGDPQMLAFTLALIRDPRLSTVVNDLVVEDGNARYQDLMNRYIRGEAVPLSALRQVWENHTVPQGAIGRSTVSPEVYRTVRDNNSSLPRERKLRVLLGDPPIDWDAVKTPADYRPWMEMRDSHPAALIQLEVLAKQRRALVMYGQMHAQRKQMASNYEMEAWQAQTMVSILERTTPTKVFSVWRESDLAKLLPDVASWRVPALAVVRGAVDFAKYSVPPMPRVWVRDGAFVPLAPDQWRFLPMEEQFDAVLYLGPSAATTTATPYSPDMCADRAYLEERLRRLRLGGPPGSADRLRQYCADGAAR
jgi:hypothetical protein